MKYLGIKQYGEVWKTQNAEDEDDINPCLPIHVFIVGDVPWGYRTAGYTREQAIEAIESVTGQKVDNLTDDPALSGRAFEQIIKEGLK